MFPWKIFIEVIGAIIEVGKDMLMDQIKLRFCVGVIGILIFPEMRELVINLTALFSCRTF